MQNWIAFLVRCTMYVVHCTPYYIQYILYDVQYTSYIVRRTLYVIHCTTYTVRLSALLFLVIPVLAFRKFPYIMIYFYYRVSDRCRMDITSSLFRCISIDISHVTIMINTWHPPLNHVPFNKIIYHWVFPSKISTLY